MASRAVLTNLPERVVEELDSLVEQGIFDNRSEALREAARSLIRQYKVDFRARAVPLRAAVKRGAKGLIITNKDKDIALERFVKQSQ